MLYQPRPHIPKCVEVRDSLAHYVRIYDCLGGRASRSRGRWARKSRNVIMTAMTEKTATVLYNFPSTSFRFSGPHVAATVVSCEPDVRHLLLVGPSDGVHFLSKGNAAAGERSSDVDEDGDDERIDIEDEDEDEEDDDNQSEIQVVGKRKTSIR